MRLPQELVDAIVAYVQHEKGNQVLLCLLQASTTVFTPQICLNLQYEPISLDSFHSYRHLSEISKLCPAILTWHLRVEANAKLLDRLFVTLPAALLNNCTCLRSLQITVAGRFIEWSMLPAGYRAALYKCMKLPTLEKLQLQYITVTPAAVEEFTALSLPPQLKTIRISRIRLVMISGTYFSAQPTMARTPATTTFSCDHQSLPFARLIYNPRPYPFGDLHELELASDDAGVDSAAQQILADNPRLTHLTFQCNSSLLPAYNLRENIALRTLTLRFRIPVEIWEPVGFPEVLDSIPGSGTRTLESFSLVVSTEETTIDFWRAVDEALCRFQMLKSVEVHLKNPFAGQDTTSASVIQEETTSSRFPGLWDAMGKTRERGILKMTLGQ